MSAGEREILSLLVFVGILVLELVGIIWVVVLVMRGGSEDGYRRTVLDWRGPEAPHYLPTVNPLIMLLVAGAFIGGALAMGKGPSAGPIVLSALGVSVVFAVSWWYFVTRFYRGVGKVFGEFIQPSGAGSYERQYSQEDALVMRGDVDGALASYERIMLEAPKDAQPRIRAAELYAKSGMRERAETLFCAVQRIPRVARGDDVYASNRLVDLYLAWPGHETKGLRELKRLIDTYPETAVAERARAGLVNLQSQLGVPE